MTALLNVLGACVIAGLAIFVAWLGLYCDAVRDEEEGER